MHKQTHKRAFYTLAGCIAALALCVAASLFLLTPAPKAQDVTIPGTRGDIYATVQLPGKLVRVVVPQVDDFLRPHTGAE